MYFRPKLQDHLTILTNVTTSRNQKINPNYNACVHVYTENRNVYKTSSYITDKFTSNCTDKYVCTVWEKCTRV